MARLRIETLGRRGDGVAEGPVHVARALPGEIVEGSIDGGRIETPRIVTPSPDRVSPRCPHFRACGGCALQHASDRLVAGWKTGLVASALGRRGLSPEVGLAHVSPAGTRRRAALSGRRLKGGAVVGFHARASDTVTDIPGCAVLTPAILAELPRLRDLVQAFGSRRGAMRLLVTDSDTGLDVAVEGPALAGAAAIDRAGGFARDGGWARLVWNGEVLAQAVAPAVAPGGIRVPIPSGVFLQATRPAEAAMIDFATGALADIEGEVLDLFCGIGTFALPLARRHPVRAYDAEPQAIAALIAGWRGTQGLRRVDAEARDLFRSPLGPDEIAGAAAAVIDPPRAGAERQVAAIAESGLSRLVHLSCNPETFARDAATLVAAGFSMGPVAVFDQFRWSPHVELAAAFSR